MAKAKRLALGTFRPPKAHYDKLFQSKPYGHEDWAQYRCSTWRHRLEPLVFMHVAWSLKWQIAWVLFVSVAVCLYQHFAVPEGYSTLSPTLAASAMSATVTFALSLLLVFKTNSAYGHWWEGRIAWGQIVNFARNYARMAMLWLPVEPPELRTFALRWAMAAPHILRVHLLEVQEGHDMASEMQGKLKDSEIEWLLTWRNPLGAPAAAMSEAVASAHLPPQLTFAMQEQINVYINMSGACERIFKTPIPPAYTRHTSRFLMIYLTVAPFMLWGTMGWATPAGAGMLAFLLLGVENIGVQIEEPFHVLPLLAICKGLDSGLSEMLSNHAGARRLLLADTHHSAPPHRPHSSGTSGGGNTSGPPSPSDGAAPFLSGHHHHYHHRAGGLAELSRLSLPLAAQATLRLAVSHDDLLAAGLA